MVHVRLLGELALQTDARIAPTLPVHPQGPALVAWLALHPGEQLRGPIAARLWPDLATSQSRAGLRSAVWALRRALGPLEGAVLDGRATIGLRCTTDLRAFEERLAAGDPAAALELCRGPLLQGFEEHDWVLAARAAHAPRVAAARAALAAG